jgi:hypothetical protein
MTIQAPVTIITNVDADLTEDQVSRIGGLVVGNGHVDYAMGYEDLSGVPHQLAAVHFTKESNPDVGRGDTKLSGIDGIEFGHDVFIYLEDTDGNLTGLNAAKSLVKSQHYSGAIFDDADGQAWFCGTQEAFDGVFTGDEPLLFKISDRGYTASHLDEMEFYLFEDGNMTGEFWISQEDTPHVTSVPWWSGFGTPIPQPRDGEDGLSEVRALARMKQRTAAMNPTPEVASMPAIAEFLLDYPAFRAGEIKLAAAPEAMMLAGGPITGEPPVAWNADIFQRAYHGIYSYESALDAAGYERESQMRAPDAPIFVTLGTVDDDGTLHISTPAFKGSVSAIDIYAAHGMALPAGAEPAPEAEDDSPTP